MVVGFKLDQDWVCFLFLFPYLHRMSILCKVPLEALLYWTALGLVGFDPTTSRSQGCDQLLCYNHWPFPLVSSSLHKLWSSDFEIKCIIILPIFYGTSKRQLPSSNHSRPNKTAIKVGFIFWTKPQFPFWISVQDRTV